MFYLVVFRTTIPVLVVFRPTIPELVAVRPPTLKLVAFRSTYDVSKLSIYLFLITAA